MSSISFKASYKNAKRRFSLETPTTYADFALRLSSLFSLPPPFTIAYEDDESDMVFVSSDAELKELFTIASTANISPLRLHIYDSGDEVPLSAPEPMEEVPRSAPQQQPDEPRSSLDGILSGVAHVLAAMRNAEVPPSFRGSRRGHSCGFGGRGGRGGRGGHGGRGQRFPRGPGFLPPGPRPGPPPFGPFDGLGALFSGLAPMFAALSGAQGGGGGDFFSPMQGVSQETKDAFHAFINAVMAVDNRAAVMTSARNALPVVHEWMRGNLGESGTVEPAAIATLVTNVQNAVGASLGQDITGLLTTLVRTAMGDAAVLEMLRQLPAEMPFDWEAELHVPMGREALGAGGFSVHRHVECDGCGTSPIVGSRFKATNYANYDLCATCYNSESVNKEGKEFRECKFVWQAELENAAVPPTPLSMGDRGHRVAFLQKVLTDLGYMNENMYRRAVGMFGPNTRMAVLQFQREYGLNEVAEEGVYDATTGASLSSVLEAQVPPTAAAGGANAGPSSSTTADEAPAPSPAQG